MIANRKNTAGFDVFCLAALAMAAAMPAFALWGNADLLAATPVPVGTAVRIEFEGMTALFSARVVKTLPNGRLAIVGRFESSDGYVILGGELDAGHIGHDRIVKAADVTGLAIVVRGRMAEFRATRLPPDARIMFGPLPRVGSAGR